MSDGNNTPTLTILVPFDLGCIYRIPSNFEWGRIPAMNALGSGWGFDKTIFTEDFTPPLLHMIVKTWSVAPFKPLLPWGRVDSAHFLFALEGVAILIVKGHLESQLHDFKRMVEDWEKGDSAFSALSEKARAATNEFDQLAINSGLRRDLARDGACQVKWVYSILYSPEPSIYQDDALGENLSFSGAKVDIAWRGAYICTNDQWNAQEVANRKAIDAAFTASSLSWASIHGLDKLLTSTLQKYVLRMPTDHLSVDEAEKVRDIQFVSNYLLDTTETLRWTIRGYLLSILTQINEVWQIDGLRSSIGDKAELVSLPSHQIEQRWQEKMALEQETHRKEVETARVKQENADKKRAEESKKQSERIDFNIKLVGLVLAAASLYGAISNFLNLRYKGNLSQSHDPNWLLASYPFIGLILVLVLAFKFYLDSRRNRRQGS